jgi:hypothetical protein
VYFFKLRLKLGTANELSDRYGDYFAASPDPSDRLAIWIASIPQVDNMVYIHRTVAYFRYVNR